MPRKKKLATPKERAQAVLNAYAETCNLREACRQAGISHKTHYRWLEKYPKYAELFRKTKLYAAEYVESVAVERATVGKPEPVYYQGKRCGSVQRYSDGLMLRL